MVVTEEGLSVQEKRRQLLERKRQEKREQQVAMGLSATTAAARKEDVSGICLVLADTTFTSTL